MSLIQRCPYFRGVLLREVPLYIQCTSFSLQREPSRSWSQRHPRGAHCRCQPGQQTDWASCRGRGSPWGFAGENRQQSTGGSLAPSPVPDSSAAGSSQRDTSDLYVGIRHKRDNLLVSFPDSGPGLRLMISQVQTWPIVGIYYSATTYMCSTDVV